MPGCDDFSGWLGGRAGYAWGCCEGCGVHLLDDAGRAACTGQGGPLATDALGEACPACLALAAAVRLAGPTTTASTEKGRRSGPVDWPEVVTLCGSMRFYAGMLAVAAAETAAGRIVLAPFCVVAPGEQDTASKRRLDRLHLAKIDLADRVLVVTDAAGYVGESTRRELEHATAAGIPVEWRRTSTAEAAA